jgi:phage-related protein
VVHIQTEVPHPLRVRFYRSEAAREPVREWLWSLSKEERKLIGEDIKTVQFRWPLGMPLVRRLTGKIYEIRTHLPNRIARTLFFPETTTIVLLHGFIKKTQQTPKGDLDVALKRLRSFLGQS